MVETDVGAVEVFDYIETYIREQLGKAGEQRELSQSPNPRQYAHGCLNHHQEAYRKGTMSMRQKMMQGVKKEDADAVYAKPSPTT